MEEVRAETCAYGVPPSDEDAGNDSDACNGVFEAGAVVNGLRMLVDHEHGYRTMSRVRIGLCAHEPMAVIIIGTGGLVSANAGGMNIATDLPSRCLSANDRPSHLPRYGPTRWKSPEEYQWHSRSSYACRYKGDHTRC